MKRFLIGLGVVLAGAMGCLALMASQHVPRTPSGTKFEGEPIGGMSRPELERWVRNYWEEAAAQPIAMRLEDSRDDYSADPRKLGLQVDLEASVAQVEFEGFFESMWRTVSSERPKGSYEIKLREGKADLGELEKFVAERVPEREPARAFYRDGGIVRVPEVAGFKLDKSKVFERAMIAFENQETGSIPVVLDKKKVPDQDLGKITEVMSEFTTRFSEGKASRSHNIRNASKRIDGIVLAPGEQFSFNKTVGRRTRESGFMIAGVYKNGKHDVDIGGGICQVSTTLYNAALFANLKIPKRSNHSMPVPYVPLGRDATVDYGSVDLVLENNNEIPIAINVQVDRGAITFRILGQKDPSLSVKMLSSGARSWDVGEKVQPDPTMPAGARYVVDRGSRGHAINTYRVVYRDGVEVKREPLGLSHYRGGKRIVAVGTARATPSPSTAASSEPPPDFEAPPPPDEGD